MVSVWTIISYYVSLLQFFRSKYDMRKIVLTIVVMFSYILGYAQDMRSLFIAIPDSIMPLLTKVNREDFGDFLDSGMKAEVKNRFGNKSEMRKMTSDYVDLQLTSSSNVEMKLLPMLVLSSCAVKYDFMLFPS